MISKLISGGKRVVIPATSGTETLATANDVFISISSDFIKWGCDRTEQATPTMAVEVYEQCEDADYPEIFGSLNQNFDRLVLTTPQIKGFVANLANDFLLEAEWTCFRFLFKAGDELFIADVRILLNGNREVRVTRFFDGSIRHAEYRHRIVVPLLVNL
jgi:hypothetical protein